MPSKKRPQPEHNTPPHKNTEKKNKPSNKDKDEENLYCDRCTEMANDLVQCERCDMWLCADCEKISPEAIHSIGIFSECRVHWFCRACDKLAINAVKSYSHMSNPLIKEVTSCLNDTLMKPLNAVNENVNKVVDNVQVSLAKSLNNNTVPDESQRTINTHNGISTESVASLTTSLFNEQKEREKRELNLVLHNMPESTASESSHRKKMILQKLPPCLKNTLKLHPPSVMQSD